MSTEDTTSTGLPRGLVLTLAAGLVAVAAVVGYLLMGKSSHLATLPPDGRSARQVEESPLEQTRDLLTKANDLGACRSALQLINSHLSDNRDFQPSALAAAERAALQQQMGLSADEIRELDSSSFTTLDAHHLDRCFLFRDAAQSLAVTAGTGSDGAPVARSPLEWTAAAFDWVVRQVALDGSQGEPAPPEFVLRRGSGDALERALVFLALLQAREGGDVHGCLLSVRDKADAPPQLWACGALIDGSPNVYLFDPRLGLPLPGKDGKGIATLQSVRADPSLLKQLHADARQQYDVTPEAAGKAEALVVCILSALSPRMRMLPQLLPPPLRLNFSEDATVELERWQKALQSSAGGVPVQVWKEGVGLTRRFLPVEEGGSDTPHPMPLKAVRGFTAENDPTITAMTRKQLFEISLVPWHAFPPELRDVRRFPYNIGLGQRVRDIYGRPFLRAALEPGQPRDEVLRGHYQKAAEALVQQRDQLRTQEVATRDLSKQALLPRLEQWSGPALAAYADLLRARTPEDKAAASERIQKHWERAEPVYTLLGAAVAQQRGPDTAYLLALCKQEEAEVLQARLDLRSRAKLPVTPRETAAARTAWKNALSWWTRYVDENPHGPRVAAARRLHARAAQMAGNRDLAVALLEADTEPTPPLDRLGRLYLARQLRAAEK